MDGSAAVDGGSAAVDVDAPTKKRDKKAAHLQRAVDPLLLVSSKSKGPPRHRQFPTQKQPKAMKVCLHDTACAWHEVPDLLHSPSFSPDSKALRLNLFNWRRWRRLEENELGRLRRHLHVRLDQANGVKVQSLFVSQIF